MPVYKLPMEIRLWCIIPFTYILQSPELLRDVRSHRVDVDILDNVYGVQHLDNILLFDLKNFCGINRVHDIYTNYVIGETEIEIEEIEVNCYDLWKRHFLYSYFSMDSLYEQINLFCHSNLNISRKNRFIWGLLTPEERTRFINEYVIE